MKQLISNVKENIFFLISTLLFMTLSLIAINAVHAQPIDPGKIVDDIKNATDWSQLLNLETAVYTFLITVGGYLSAFIPGLRSIDSGVYRILVWAILVIAGSLVIGVGNVWLGAISYFFSTSLYEVVLKLFKPSPKPNTTA